MASGKPRGFHRFLFQLGDDAESDWRLVSFFPACERVLIGNLEWLTSPTLQPFNDHLRIVYGSYVFYTSSSSVPDADLCNVSRLAFLRLCKQQFRNRNCSDRSLEDTCVLCVHGNRENITVRWNYSKDYRTRYQQFRYLSTSRLQFRVVPMEEIFLGICDPSIGQGTAIHGYIIPRLTEGHFVRKVTPKREKWNRWRRCIVCKKMDILLWTLNCIQMLLTLELSNLLLFVSDLVRIFKVRDRAN